MSDYKPVKGDRVRVVLEGTVDIGSAGYVTLIPDGRDAASIGLSRPRMEEFNVSIEKIEPPVEVFGPGDVVRHLGNKVSRYAIGHNGYFSFQGNDFREHDESFLQKTFTSKDYVRVELG